MFQPETEDMLPRMAPKPSGSVGGGGGPTEPIIRPQVPEVSILFGQQQGAGGNVQTQLQPQNYQQQTQQTTSYATWKKQMLPKVTFPPILTQEIPKTNNLPESNGPRNNLYPMRTTANTVAPAISSNAYMVTSTNPSYVTSATDRPNNGYVGNIVATTYSPTYRQSLESYGGTNQPTQQQQQQQVNMYRKSVEVTSPPTQSYSSSRDVLTICAGTQTDTISSPNRGQQNVPLNVASKEDMEDLKQIVQEMRHNQLCIIQMMEKFICNQQHAENVRRVETKDMATQVNSNTKGIICFCLPSQFKLFRFIFRI